MNYIKEIGFGILFATLFIVCATLCAKINDLEKDHKSAEYKELEQKIDSLEGTIGALKRQGAAQELEIIRLQRYINR